ncbi:hypothetical protein [Paenibacillus dakarensis]|uniref:hypothetical protein n=1 Tax=Paenibacillus dakarensis TaxID=1527293 RepID=UPI000B2FA0D7|nr:hypothetical protein [Paenibacillus dakarensis]
MKEPLKCDRIGCNQDAVYQGHIYGHVKGEDPKDSFLPVNACESHSKSTGFYIEAKLK